MDFKKNALILSVCFTPLILNSCGVTFVQDDYDKNTKELYNLAKQNGIFTGTYEEWLETVRGADGKSAYDLYIEKHPEYTKTEDEWLEDLVNGRLATQRYHTVTFNTNCGLFLEPIKVLHGERIPMPQLTTYEDEYFTYELEGRPWNCGDYDWLFDIYPCTGDVTLDCSTIAIPKDENKGVCFLGPSSIKHGGEFIKEWDNFDGTNGIARIMTYDDISSYNQDLYDTLPKDNVACVYKIDDIEVGHSALANWTTKWGNPVQEINGTYCFKFAEYVIDENSKYTITKWITSPESGDIINYTPNTLWTTPNFSEIQDENGYDQFSNPTIIAGAGSYRAYLIRFKTPIDGKAFGVAVYKNYDLPEYIPPAKQIGWKLTGGINGEDHHDANDIQFMSLVNNKITVALNQYDNFYITRILDDGTGDMENHLGGRNIESAPEGCLARGVGVDPNIRIARPGTYTIEVTPNNRIIITLETQAV